MFLLKVNGAKYELIEERERERERFERKESIDL